MSFVPPCHAICANEWERLRAVGNSDFFEAGRAVEAGRHGGASAAQCMPSFFSLLFFVFSILPAELSLSAPRPPLQRCAATRRLCSAQAPQSQARSESGQAKI